MNAAGFNIPKEGSAQDADPLLFYRTDLFMVGCFDGLGGAGTAEYHPRDNPELIMKSAELGSRIASNAINAALLKGRLNFDDLAGCMRIILKEAHQEARDYYVPLPVRFKSKELLEFPTTCACLAGRREGGLWKLTSVTCGDSRNYILSTTGGLMQISADDVVYESLSLRHFTENPHMNNVISTRDFELKESCFYLKELFIAISCTDGCFGYFLSPMHFELALMDAILSSGSLEDMGIHLQHCIGSTTMDDSSMAMVLPFKIKWKAMRRWAQDRRNIILSKYLPASNTNPSDYFNELELRWMEYRLTHLQYSYPES